MADQQLLQTTSIWVDGQGYVQFAAPNLSLDEQEWHDTHGCLAQLPDILYGNGNSVSQTEAIFRLATINSVWAKCRASADLIDERSERLKQANICDITYSLSKHIWERDCFPSVDHIKNDDAIKEAMDKIDALYYN